MLITMEVMKGNRVSITQCYLSPDYEADCKQVEQLKNMILDESEKLYNQKIEEIKNQTICEAPGIWRTTK